MSRPTGAVTNYATKLIVGESAGASGCDVHCDGLCRSDFGDLRFTESIWSNRPAAYYIDSILGITPNRVATVWVKFGSIGTSAERRCMYYGNPIARSKSDGAATFIKFDDFERGSNGDSVGGGIWTWANGATISTDHAFNGSRSCKLAGHTAGWTNYFTNAEIVPDNVLLFFRFWKENAASFGNHIYRGLDYAETDVTAAESIRYSAKDTGHTSAADQWDWMEIRALDWTAKTYDIYDSGGLVKTSASMSAAGDNHYFCFFERGAGVGNDTYFDTIYMRKWFAVEPSWGTWGPRMINPFGMGFRHGRSRRSKFYRMAA